MAPLTRIGRKRAASASMMEQLPADIMMRILNFVELPDRLQLSSSSNIINKLIMQDCSALWVTIDLSPLFYKVQQRLSDDMLAGLLTRVNARNVTKTLILRYCSSIKGQGLNPL